MPTSHYPGLRPPAAAAKFFMHDHYHYHVTGKSVLYAQRVTDNYLVLLLKDFENYHY